LLVLRDQGRLALRLRMGRRLSNRERVVQADP
jgi:hypothetical protein